MHTPARITLVTTATLLALSNQAQAAVILQEDFQNPSDYAFGGSSVASNGNVGTFARFQDESATITTLTSASTYTLKFDLIAIGSLNPYDHSLEDRFVLTAGGTQIFEATVDHRNVDDLSLTFRSPDERYNISTGGGSDDINVFRSVTVTFETLSDNLALELTADTTGNDEYFGIDNVLLSSTPTVPSPGSFAIILPLAGLTAVRRRSRAC